jgi:hypothetical protein
MGLANIFLFVYGHIALGALAYILYLSSDFPTFNYLFTGRRVHVLLLGLLRRQDIQGTSVEFLETGEKLRLS